MYYTVMEISERLNIPPSTIRYYSKMGLMPFLEYGQNGVRKFKEEDIEYLQIIEYLKKTGFSLGEIKDYIEYLMKGKSTIQERKQLFEKRRQAVDAEIQRLLEVRESLKNLTLSFESAGRESVV